MSRRQALYRKFMRFFHTPHHPPHRVEREPSDTVYVQIIQQNLEHLFRARADQPKKLHLDDYFQELTKRIDFRRLNIISDEPFSPSQIGSAYYAAIDIRGACDTEDEMLHAYIMTIKVPEDIVNPNEASLPSSDITRLTLKFVAQYMREGVFSTLLDNPRIQITIEHCDRALPEVTAEGKIYIRGKLSPIPPGVIDPEKISPTLKPHIRLMLTDSAPRIDEGSKDEIELGYLTMESC